jgi:acyl-CoA thioester hydrolase
MPETFIVQRRVEFCETDAAGIAHFSAFMCYMEQAEHAFWRSLGTSVVQVLSGDDDQQSGWHLSWPRVHVECDYRGSARFEDVLDIQVSILKLGEKSITYGFDFHVDDNRIASGKVVAVCCKVRAGQPLESMPIPAELKAKLAMHARTLVG